MEKSAKRATDDYRILSTKHERLLSAQRSTLAHQAESSARFSDRPPDRQPEHPKNGKRGNSGNEHGFDYFTPTEFDDSKVINYYF